MPFPNEHAARVHDPSKYKRIRRENNKFDKGIHVVWGVLNDGTVEVQSIRFDKKKFTVAEAKDWLREHGYKSKVEPAEGAKMADDLNEATVDVRRVEIFRAGDYGEKGKFSVADLDEIASRYDPAAHEAPVTLDHRQDGPAFGWVRKLWREGVSLFADLAKVPKSFLDAIMRGRYTKRSVELYEVDGRPMLRALSFLGAQVPHVKGMADIRFHDDGTTRRDVDWAEAARGFNDLQMAEHPGSPDPSAHGVLVEQIVSDSMLDHYHQAFLDSERNGYTGHPVYWDSQSGYGDQGDTHQHLILSGLIQPAGEPGREHIHALTFVTVETTSTEETTMSEKEKTKDALDPRIADLEKKYAEERAVREAVEARLAKMEADGRREKRDAAFTEAWTAGLRAGRVIPAERNGLKALYDALPEPPVKFGDAEKTLHAVFLETLAARPVAVKLGAMKEFADTPPGAPAIDPDDSAARAARADEIVTAAKLKGAKMTYAEAHRLVEKEIQTGTRAV